MNINITDNIIHEHEWGYRELRKSLSTPNIIYCLYNPLSKLFKIGYTERRLRTRINTLQNQSGMELQLFFAFHVNKKHRASSYEKSIHYLFYEKRCLGEWFRLSEEEAFKIKNSLQMIKNIHEINIDMKDLLTVEIQENEKN